LLTTPSSRGARRAVSARVDPKSLIYKSVYSDWSIPALALK
jgi:hypothetical protein